MTVIIKKKRNHRIFLLLILVFNISCAVNTTSKRVEKNKEEIVLLRNQLRDYAIKMDAFFESDQQNEEIKKLRQRVTFLEEELRKVKQQMLPQSEIIRVSHQAQIADITSEKIAVHYHEARQQYISQNFDKALLLFRDFLTMYPSHDLAANSQYWIGEIFYDRDQFEYAINEFQKVIDFYHASPKAPDAQLKIGLCYKQLDRPKQAHLELSRIKKMYPNYERQNLVNDFIQALKQ